MFFKRKAKEQEIQQIQIEQQKKVDRAINDLKQINKILSDGVTIRVYRATGGHK